MKKEGNEGNNYWLNDARYDWFLARKRGNIPEKLFYNLKIKYILSLENFNNKIILDLACGTGVNTFDFYKKSRRTIGTDLSSWAIERAKIYFPKVDFRVMDSGNMDFDDNYFDIVVSTGLIQYLINPEKSVKEVHRILKPGGTVISEVPWSYGIYNAMPIRRLLTGKYNPNNEPVNNAYTSNEFRRLFNDFKVISIRNFFTIVLYGIFVKR